MSILKVQNLTKTFSVKPAFTAVNNISFHLNEGEILGFLGPNGAGKTTTIQMLLGTLTPTSGVIEYFGKDFVKHRSDILQHVSFASTYLRLPPNLTVYENLDVFGRLYGLNKAERENRIKKYLILFDMWRFHQRKVSGLSAGQMTRVMLAKAFLPEPRIVLLDEPTASLDPDVSADIRAFVLERQLHHKTSIIFTSHNMAEVEEVCDRVLVIKNGVIIADQEPQILAKSVHRSRVRLLGLDRERFMQFALEHKLNFLQQPHEIEIELDEEQIGWLFSSLAHANITYSQVSIDQPTLEDYFLEVTKK